MNRPMPSSVTFSLWPAPAPWPAGHPLCGRAFARDVPVETDISEPSLTFWAPDEGLPARTAVIICPGGGYQVLAAAHEGDAVARWLNALGLAAFVLRYRVPGPGHPAPLEDVRAAVRLVRGQAAEFGVAPDRVGLLGFSAGGHLAGCAGLLPGERDARLDFLLLIYPVVSLCEPWAHAGSASALLGESAGREQRAALSLERCADQTAPPVFLVHAEDDPLVPVENSRRLAAALSVVGTTVTAHFYERGGHGFGLGAPGHPAADWPREAEAWLRRGGWLAGSLS